jgi:hypothetical protein
MSDRDTERRTQEAQRILDEPLFQEALAQIEQQAIEDMLSIKGWRWGDKRRRIAAERINTIRGIKAHLTGIVVQGTQARRPRAIA